MTCWYQPHVRDLDTRVKAGDRTVSCHESCQERVSGRWRVSGCLQSPPYSRQPAASEGQRCIESLGPRLERCTQLTAGPRLMALKRLVSRIARKKGRGKKVGSILYSMHVRVCLSM